MNHYQLLDIKFGHSDQQQIITPVLLQDEHDTILVDCGYPDFMPLLEAAVNNHEITLHSLTKLIITHHDMDHVGSLAALKRAYPHISIVAHEIEAPYIEGKLKSKRLEQAESTFGALPEEAKPQAEQFIQLLKSIEPAVVDQTVSNEEWLPWCGGLQFIHTPGHTPGHMSLFLPAASTLIAGDALVIEQGRLELANPQYTLDLAEAVRSIQRLLDYDIEQVICYHGGLFHGDVKQALRQIVQTYQS